jgi:hypothetical protein
MAVTAKPNAVGDTAEVSDIGDPPTSQAAATPTIFGKVARDNWRTRSLQRLHRIFEDMENAPSEVRGELSVHIDSFLSAAEAASPGAAKQRTCYTGADFQKPTSAREAAQHVQLCIQHHCSQRYKEQEGHVQPDTQHQERKAWKQHHSVIQTSQHVQSCHNHQSSIQSQAQAGHQANRCTASKELSRREQAPGLPQAPAVNLLGAWIDNSQRTTD